MLEKLIQGRERCAAALTPARVGQPDVPIPPRQQLLHLPSTFLLDLLECVVTSPLRTLSLLFGMSTFFVRETTILRRPEALFSERALSLLHAILRRSPHDLREEMVCASALARAPGTSSLSPVDAGAVFERMDMPSRHEMWWEKVNDEVGHSDELG